MIERKTATSASLIYFFALSAILLLSYAWYDYKTEYANELKRLDEKLLAFATTTRSITGLDFHQAPLTKGSVDRDQEYYWGKKLTEITQAAGLKYIYTMIKDGDTIRFLNSSFSPEEISGEEEWNPVFWTDYNEADPGIHQAFNENNAVYLYHSDRWGSFRSVFLRTRSEGAQTILIGVDAGLESIQRLKYNALTRTAVSLSILLLILAFWWRTIKQHQTTLAQTNERINNALAGAHLALWEWNMRNDAFYLSPIFSKLYGYKEGEFPTHLRRILEFIHPDEQDLFTRMFTEAANCGDFENEFQDYEFRFRHKNGHYIWGRSQGKNLAWDKHGRPTLRAGIVENIDTIKTYQKQLLEVQVATLERERFLSSLLENLPDYVSLKDPSGAYINCNNAMSTLFNLPRQEIVGKTDFHLVNTKLAETFRENDLKAMQSNDLVRVQEWINVNGSPQLLDTFKVSLLDTNKNVVGVVSIGRDITENHQLMLTQKRILDDLKVANEKANTANKSKTLFLANMSHEIRTPLNAILGYSQLLNQEKDIPPLISERLTFIHDAGTRLLSLINDILDLSKIESGKSNLLIKPFNLTTTLNDNIQLLQNRCTQKNIELTLASDIPEKYTIETDRQKLNQIITNLLSNAIKFTDTGNVTLGCNLTEDTIIFSVSDSGCGINEDEQAQLFQSFSQGKRGADIGGTGLGLALCKRLITLMGGSISLESKPNIGTNVTFTLPRSLVESNETATDGAYTNELRALKAGQTLSVLVIDDDEHSRKVLCELLAKVGFNVSALDDSTLWRKSLDDGDIQMVFTDIRMPDLSGDALLAMIKADEHYSHIPVVAVTASSLEHERSHYLTIGFDDFVSKPISLGELNYCLERLFPDALEPLTQESETDTAAQIEPKTAFSQFDQAVFTNIKHACSEGNSSSISSQIEKLSQEATSTQLYSSLSTLIKTYDLVSAEKLLAEF